MSTQTPEHAPVTRVTWTQTYFDGVWCGIPASFEVIHPGNLESIGAVADCAPDDARQVGPVVEQAGLDKVRAQVEYALTRGARAVVGGASGRVVFSAQGAHCGMRREGGH